ncbi:unnamed protein product, partial [Rotaria socialis]
ERNGTLISDDEETGGRLIDGRLPVVKRRVE